MARFTGVNRTNIEALPQVSVASQELHGKVRYGGDRYEAVATASGSDLAMGSTIRAGSLFKGMGMWADALGTGVTLTAKLVPTDGTAATTIFNGIVCTSATFTTTGAAAYIDLVGAGVLLAKDCDVIVTTGVGPATGTISVAYEYVASN